MENILKFENKFKKVLIKKENLSKIFITIIILLALFIRYKMLKFESGDYIYHLSNWFNEIKKLGGFKALKYNIGDYNAPYLTIMAFLTYLPFSSLTSIKLVSIIFDFLGAYYASKLVMQNTKNNKLLAVITFTIILFLPTVWMNSSLWAQCDFIYVTFILMSLYYLRKNKLTLSFILLGLAFSFKLQFIFILPIYLIMYFQEKEISILHFLIIPIVNIILCIPSFMAGKSFMDCMLIYFNQTGTYGDLTLNYPNLYYIFKEFFNNQSLILIIITIIILGILALVIINNKIKIKDNLIKYGLLFSWIMVYCLPRMHERYAFLPEILSIIYVFIYKKDYYLPIILELGAMIGYYQFLARTPVDINIWYIVVIIEFVGLCKFINDNFIKEDFPEKRKKVLL